QREVRADAARTASAQVLLLERAVDHHGRRCERTLDQVANPEAGGRRAAEESAHRPADRRDVRQEGREDRAPHRRQVPRSARHPARAHAQAAMSLATNSTPPDVSVLVPAKDEVDNLGEFVRLTREAMLPLPYAVELVIVDDGSHDGSAKLLDELAVKRPLVKVVAERPVPVHPRRAGSSKFGVARIPVGVLDLMSVWFQLRFARKPMLFFGVIGATLFSVGLLTGIIALYLRFGPPHLGFRPLLDLI